MVRGVINGKEEKLGVEKEQKNNNKKRKEYFKNLVSV
jgi:hypothetical protein